MAKGSNRARQLAHAHVFRRRIESRQVALHLRIPVQNLQAKRRRLRMNPMRPSDRRRVLELDCAPLQHLRQPHQSFADVLRGFLHLQRLRGVARHRGAGQRPVGVRLEAVQGPVDRGELPAFAARRPGADAMKEFEELTGINVGFEQIPEQQQRPKVAMEMATGHPSFDVRECRHARAEAAGGKSQMDGGSASLHRRQEPDQSRTSIWPTSASRR